jgi:hypothetical protein
MAVVSAVTKMMVAADVVADLNFRRQVERLHRLGPRVTAIDFDSAIETVNEAEDADLPLGLGRD